MPQSFVSLYFHVIFSTRFREPLLVGELPTGLYKYMGGYLRNRNSKLVGAGGTPDHVHLLVSLHQQVAVADLLRGMKASASNWVHENYENLAGFAWQHGYGAFSVSYSNVPDVQDYIDRQVEHHRHKSFQEEFIEFLNRHDMPYDERYLWE
jgi:putative transposase